MGMLPFYMFMHTTGTLEIYQQSTKFWTQMFESFQPKTPK